MSGPRVVAWLLADLGWSYDPRALASRVVVGWLYVFKADKTVFYGHSTAIFLVVTGCVDVTTFDHITL